MKHIKTWIIPDCPKCGKELREMARFDTTKASPKNPFGWKMHYWECEDCGYTSEAIHGELEIKQTEEVIKNETTN